MLEDKNDNLHEPADGLVQPATTKNSTQKALESITADNAADSEQNQVNETEQVQVKAYEQMDIHQILEELQSLQQTYSIKRLTPVIEAIKKAFSNAFTDDIELQKQTYFDANPDAKPEDFQANLQVKEDFDNLIQDLKDKKVQYSKDLQQNLQSALELRLEIIDQIKALIDSKPAPSEALSQINELREKWKSAGAIPKDKYNHVWNNYHFHMERFYDQLDLNREARDLDFKFNLEQKQRIIERAKELLLEQDIIKAYRELQTLHRIWREEVGPVEKELREGIWDEFSEISKELHDKREEILNFIKRSELDNLGHKVAIISEIDTISKSKVDNHNQWQQHIKKVEELRNRFFAIGNVPMDNTEEVWQLLKLAVRNFNNAKNHFYKALKVEQQENLRLKQDLIKKAKQHAVSEDFDRTTPIMKTLQNKWKSIGHVPRKQSDVLWKEFKEVCNGYFDRLHIASESYNKIELEAYNRKKEYLDLLKGFQLSGDHKTDLKEIKNHINNWKTLGSVPQNKRFIEGKFNKLLDTFFNQLSISRKEAETVKYNHHLEYLATNSDGDKLRGEIIHNRRKLEETKNEILQLQNNLAYIQNPSATNPLVKEVYKSITKLEQQSEVYKEKLQQLRELTK